MNVVSQALIYLISLLVTAHPTKESVGEFNVKINLSQCAKMHYAVKHMGYICNIMMEERNELMVNL